MPAAMAGPMLEQHAVSRPAEQIAAATLGGVRATPAGTARGRGKAVRQGEQPCVYCDVSLFPSVLVGARIVVKAPDFTMHACSVAYN